MARILRSVWRFSWLAIAVLLIGAAVVLTLARLALPFADEYQRDIEVAISDYLGAEVRADVLDLEWHRFGPRLRLDGVEIEHPDGDVIRVTEAYVHVGIAANMRSLRVREVTLAGLDLAVELTADGDVDFWGLTLDPAGLLATADDAADDADWESDAVAAAAELLEGLLAVDRLRIIDADLDITTATGELYRLTDVAIHLLNEGRRNRLSIRGQLPAGWGDSLRVAVDARGLAGDPRAAVATLHFAGEGLRLDPWRELLVRLGMDVPTVDARGDASLWLDWRDAQVQRVTADVVTRDIRVGGAGEDFRADAISGLADWTRRDAGWLARIENLAVERNGSAWTADTTALARTATGWRARGDALALADAVALAGPLLPLPDAENDDGNGPDGDDPNGHGLDGERLADLDLAGMLRDYRISADDTGGFHVDGDFSGLGWSPVAGWPGMTGLDGRLRLTPRGGDIHLAARDAVFMAPELFRDPLALQAIDGHVRIDRGPRGLILDAPRLAVHNPDIGGEARVRLEVPNTGSPLLDMQVDFRDGVAATQSRYLPVGIMFPALVDWLDNAIVDGRVPAGRMLFRGPTADFPFDEAPGVFQVDFDLVDGILDYAPGWPRIEDLDARVRFDGPGLAIEARHARIHDSPIEALHARFDDLQTGDLVVEAAGMPYMPDLLRLTRDSPLQQRLGAFFDGADSDDGRAGMRLRLDIPVEQAEDTRVDGSLRFAGNRLAQPRFGVDLTAIDGEVHFTEDSLAMDGVRARFHDQPITLDAETRDDTVHLHGQGDFAIAAMLAEPLPAGLRSRISGRSPWDIRVELAGQDDAGLPERTRITASSTLAGTAIDLPAPLTKSAAQTRPIHLDLPLAAGRDRHRLTASYGDDVAVLAELDTGADEPGVERGAISFGGSEPQLPEAAGWSLGGTLAELDLGAWFEAVTSGPEAAHGAAAGAAAGDWSNGVPAWFAGVDLGLDRVHGWGYEMTDVALTARQRDKALEVALASNEATGTVDWPLGRAGARPVNVRLEWLDLGLLLAGIEGDDTDPVAGEDIDGIHPRVLPAFNVDIERLLLDRITLHDFILVTTPGSDGLRMHRLEAGNEHLRLHGQGEWSRRGDRERTALRMTMTANNFGAGLDALGLTGSGFVRGDGSIVSTLDWAGAPWAPDLPSLSGDMRVRLDDGMITTVDPGPARLISLFSLQTLPRRLALDFSSLFQRGFEYDDIRGRFNFADGNAWIGRLQMEGPPGRARVTGRIGYITEDFDQEIEFRPSLTYSLPVLGTIVGGVAGGLTVTLLQQVMRGLGTDIESAAEVRYRLTGSWSDPKVERLRVEPAAELRDALPDDGADANDNPRRP